MAYGNDTSNYTISGSNLIINYSAIDSSVYEIQRPSSNKLTLYYEDLGTTDQVQEWIYLSK